MLSWSNRRHVSTIFPLAIWSIVIADTATCFPVGGMPIRSPVWAPRYMMRVTTLSPSTIIPSMECCPHGISQALNFLGDLARLQGDYVEAAAHYSESLPLVRQAGVK